VGADEVVVSAGYGAENHETETSHIRWIAWGNDGGERLE
jgi:hypothetical protein